jgi:hypothetical protein
MMTAKDDYFNAYQETLDAHSRLLALIKEHKEEALDNGINFGHVGDMNEIKASIERLISFLV